MGKRVFAVTAKACQSTINGLTFVPYPIDLHFEMPGDEFQEACSLVALALLDEGLRPEKIVRTKGR